MAEGQTKTKTEVQMVKMEDGREVGFAGKRRLVKDYIIDESKITIDGGVMQIEAGAVKGVYDFRNGATRSFDIPLQFLVQFAGHGQLQKYGDELAAPADKPLSEDDMVLALEDLDSRIQAGSWTEKREGGGGVSGASFVVKALMEVTGKDQAFVKTYLDGQLAKTPGLTRPALYAAFRADPKVKEIIRRMEDEKESSKQPKVDTGSVLAGMAA